MADQAASSNNNPSYLQNTLDDHLAALQQQQQQLASFCHPTTMNNNSNHHHHRSDNSSSNNMGGRMPYNPVANFFAQQQQQQQQQQHMSNEEQGLLRALQQQQQQQQQGIPGMGEPQPMYIPQQQQQQQQQQQPQPVSSLGNALSSVLQASSTAEMALTARNRLDEIAILRAIQGMPQQHQQRQVPQPPPAQPTPQEALSQLLANPAGLAEALEVLLGQQQQQPPPQPPAATAAPLRAPPAAAAAPKPPAIQQEPAFCVVEEEEYPLPELPQHRPLPSLEEGETPHFSERVCVPLATEEDSNWLSERQCFIRAELLEVVRASHQDVLVRSSSKSVAYQQVGIRCRYCAHLHPSARAIRSSAYPSSIRQMYQSFTMMVRDHWAGCTAMPPKLKKRFLDYQEHKIPSSSLSREYWAFAAAKIGMINTDYGITITEESLAKAAALPSFGTTPTHVTAMAAQGRKAEPLVHPSDRAAISPYLYNLMAEVEMCYLLESERVGKRKEAPVGLSGFGCQHCIQVGRLGFCRVFPLNKRSLPTKVNDLYNHFQRCPLTPIETRRALRKLKHEVTSKSPAGKFAERDREFVDQIWTKLGRKGAQIGSS